MSLPMRPGITLVFGPLMLVALLITSGCVRQFPGGTEPGALRDYCRDIKRSRAAYALVGGFAVPIAVADSQQVFGSNAQISGSVMLLSTLVTVLSSAMIAERTIELADDCAQNPARDREMSGDKVNTPPGDRLASDNASRLDEEGKANTAPTPENGTSKATSPEKETAPNAPMTPEREKETAPNAPVTPERNHPSPEPNTEVPTQPNSAE